MAEDMLRRCVAEFVGAFTLIFIGVGSIVAAHQIHDPSLIGIAIAHGLAIGIMVSAMGHISGAHFNPAITLGFLVTRRIKPALGVMYWVSQLAGAAAAAALVKGLIPREMTDAVNLGVPATGNGVNAGAAFGLEAIMTFFLAWVVFATAVDDEGAFNKIAGLAIGLTITIDVLMGGPLTGAAMNPARAFGPELAARTWTGWWVYWLGPAIGAVLAALLYEYLYLAPAKPSVVGTPQSGVDEPRPGDTALS
jgi:MIP family channel proteins